jgi:hypothetical protein
MSGTHMIGSGVVALLLMGAAADTAPSSATSVLIISAGFIAAGFGWILTHLYMSRGEYREQARRLEAKIDALPATMLALIDRHEDETRIIRSGRY